MDKIFSKLVCSCGDDVIVEQRSNTIWVELQNGVNKERAFEKPNTVWALQHYIEHDKHGIIDNCSVCFTYQSQMAVWAGDKVKLYQGIKR